MWRQARQGYGHGALAGILNALQVDALICGGIGGCAQAALAAAGIRLYCGVAGDADAAAQALASGSLTRNPNVMCNYHGERPHEGGCASHSCGIPEGVFPPKRERTELCCI